MRLDELFRESARPSWRWQRVERWYENNTKTIHSYICRYMVCRWNSQIDLIGDGWVPIEAACPWESWAGNLQICMYVCTYICTYVCVLYVPDLWWWMIGVLDICMLIWSIARAWRPSRGFQGPPVLRSLLFADNTSWVKPTYVSKKKSPFQPKVSQST